MTPEKTAQELGTDPSRGLSQEEAARRLQRLGPNELQAKEGIGFLQMLLAQFRDVLVIILLVAAGVSFLVGEPIDAGVILIIVILNALLGASQERRAGKALEALQRMASPRAQVVRDGRNSEIPTRELVPGDLVLLETGDYVPADLRLVESVNLKVEEASLTGESVPVEKRASEFLPGEAPLGDRVNSAFSGTVITYGRGSGLVTETGMRTEMGRIAEMIESYEQEETPLQEKLTGFGKVLGIVALVVVAAVFLLGLLRGRAAPAHVHDLGESRGGRDPRRASRHRDHRPRPGNEAHGQAPRNRQAAPRGGIAGQRDGHLLRQDRNAHPERDDGDGDPCRRRALRGDGERLRPGGRFPAGRPGGGSPGRSRHENAADRLRPQQRLHGWNGPKRKTAPGG